MEQHTIADDLAAEVGGACLGMRVARLHRVVARRYEQALQTMGLTKPQMEVLATLISTAGPVRLTTLAARLMLERSTISRNLALMQNRGWVAVTETSPTRRRGTRRGRQEHRKVEGNRPKAAPVADDRGQAPPPVREKEFHIIPNGQWYYGPGRRTGERPRRPG